MTRRLALGFFPGQPKGESVDCSSDGMNSCWQIPHDGREVLERGPRVGAVLHGRKVESCRASEFVGRREKLASLGMDWLNRYQWAVHCHVH